MRGGPLRGRWRRAEGGGGVDSAATVAGHRGRGASAVIERRRCGGRERRTAGRGPVEIVRGVAEELAISRSGRETVRFILGQEIAAMAKGGDAARCGHGGF